MTKPFVLLLGVALGLLSGSARGQAPTPLHAFLQQNFDSTVVFQSCSGSINSPDYLILAKYQGRPEFFTYRSPYRQALGHYFPGRLQQKFAEEERRFRAAPPDTNRYLLPQLVGSATLGGSWRLLNPSGLWELRGDQQLPKAASRCVIEDGEENTFYLITRKSIRVARFYAPDFYEQCAGADPDRQRAIRARDALLALLQETR